MSLNSQSLTSSDHWYHLSILPYLPGKATLQLAYTIISPFLKPWSSFPSSPSNDDVYALFYRKNRINRRGLLHVLTQMHPPPCVSASPIMVAALPRRWPLRAPMAAVYMHTQLPSLPTALRTSGLHCPSLIAFSLVFKHVF